MSFPDWGDVPTWVGATFAALAAGAAVWTLKSQRDQIGEQRSFIAEQSANLALERQELMAVVQERREEQARAIKLEVTPPYVKVRNSSSDPITDVRCLEDGLPPVRAAVSSGEGAEASLSMALNQLHGQELERLDVLGVARLGWFQRRGGLSGAVEISFTDDRGVRWALDSNGKLKEVPPPEPQA